MAGRHKGGPKRLRRSTRSGQHAKRADARLGKEMRYTMVDTTVSRFTRHLLDLISNVLIEVFSCQR